VLVVDAKRRVPQLDCAFDEILSLGKYWQADRILPEQIRYAGKDCTEGRRIVEGLSNPEDEMPATLRVRLNLYRRAKFYQGVTLPRSRESSCRAREALTSPECHRLSNGARVP